MHIHYVSHMASAKAQDREAPPTLAPKESEGDHVPNLCTRGGGGGGEAVEEQNRQEDQHNRQLRVAHGEQNMKDESLRITSNCFPRHEKRRYGCRKS
jgi:hypothetical protein